LRLGATHGLPIETNAHPIATGSVAVVHNGIIKNFQALRREIESNGQIFRTDTDTEAAALVTQSLERGSPPEEVSKTLERLEGAFALALLFAGKHDLLIGARRDSPLVIGYRRRDVSGLGRSGVGAADPPHYVPRGGRLGGRHLMHCNNFFAANREVERPIREAEAAVAAIGKGNYRHFMQKGRSSSIRRSSATRSMP